ncbi:hypothetical protein BKA80DRAFT_257808 [Phyllosticta citrichinensis]
MDPFPYTCDFRDVQQPSASAFHWHLLWKRMLSLTRDDFNILAIRHNVCDGLPTSGFVATRTSNLAVTSSSESSELSTSMSISCFLLPLVTVFVLFTWSNLQSALSEGHTQQQLLLELRPSLHTSKATSAGHAPDVT